MWDLWWTERDLSRLSPSTSVFLAKHTTEFMGPNFSVDVKFEIFTAMLHRVALVRTDVSEDLSASFIRVTRNGELGTTLAACVGC
jgi:hypothetical protein